MKKIVLLLLVVSAANCLAQNTQETFTIENYYKVKWGYAEEFLSLYKDFPGGALQVYQVDNRIGE